MPRVIIITICLSIFISIFSIIAYKSVSRVAEPKTLLLWTPRFANGWLPGYNHASWTISDLGYTWEDNMHSDLRDFGCDEESFNCILTSNRSYLVDTSMFDGLLFHQFDIHQEDVPDQERRGADQVYMFHTMETPIRFPMPEVPNNFFNISMTYSSISEVHLSYGTFQQTAVPPDAADLDQYIVNFGKENTGLLAGRNFSATLLVTNCQQTASDREAVISDLSKMMQVDMFGACGRPPLIPDKGNQEPTEDTHMELARTYPFYLAFENSLCEDYVTEKFYSALRSNMIPVALNGANMSKIAPKHSYIDVKDYETTRDLLDFMQKVHSDPAMYASFFWWRQFYTVDYVWRPLSREFLQTFCHACRYLHATGPPTVMKNLQEEWVEGKCIQPPIIGYLDTKHQTSH